MEHEPYQILDAKDDPAYIETYTGKKFHILHPQLSEICIEDIAHALALQCRWTGHCKFHYSIAQHSYLASYVHPELCPFEKLMHDASEAYIADINRPLKHFTKLGSVYLPIEETVQQAICAKFGLPLEQSPDVKVADNLMLYAEKRDIMGKLQWTHAWGDAEAAKQKIVQWSQRKAEKQFLKRFYELYIPVSNITGATGIF